MNKNNKEKDKFTKSLPKVSHYGTINIGDLVLDCAVLEDGTRGYIQDQFLQTLGFKGHGRMPRFRRFLHKIAPNAMVSIDNSSARL
ncbi:hypothetical protein TI03_03770 [Achromatium sp. WMS1]|nr:hypothetical protein TI03_03770 [Achromatium sp. WMS1]